MPHLQETLVHKEEKQTVFGILSVQFYVKALLNKSLNNVMLSLYTRNKIKPTLIETCMIATWNTVYLHK